LTTNGVKFIIGFIGLFDIGRDYSLEFTVTHIHTLVSAVISSLPLLGSGFNGGRCPPSGVPNWIGPHLPVSKSKSLERLSPSGPLTNSLTTNCNKVTVTLRPTVSRPVCLGAQDQIFVADRQLRVCWCGVPSVTRVRVYRIKLLPAFASAIILGAESRVNSWKHFTVSDSRLPQPVEQVFWNFTKNNATGVNIVCVFLLSCGLHTFQWAVRDCVANL
jgi:hypothetical protein